ncbi:MAG: LemA family protein [Elusimicrobia bacterium]|nr:LemA family protein [Elusimicrobiota bacterium]
MTIALIVLGVLAAWLIFTFNGLIALRNQVQNAFRQIDVQLKRRHDLIPNLVNSVKGEMKFEQDTLEKVIAARGAAVSASAGGKMSEISKKEGELSSALGRLFALSENYPNLKSSDAVRTLMEELSSTENKIAFSRQFYNDLVTGFNTKQQVFPTNMISAMLGFTAAELFELPENSAERENPKVDLSV